jgi:hypothetical protein
VYQALQIQVCDAVLKHWHKIPPFTDTRNIKLEFVNGGIFYESNWRGQENI